MQKGASTLPSWAEQGGGIFEDLDQLAVDDAINLPPVHGRPDNLSVSVLAEELLWLK